MTLQVRAASADDAPALLTLVRALAAHHGDEAHATLDTLTRDLFGPAQAATALLATASGEAVGYAVLVRLLKLQDGVRSFDLHHLFVAEAHRGRGVGSALVARAAVQARSERCATLSVAAAADNVAAARFYAKLGFAPRPHSGARFRLVL